MGIRLIRKAAAITFTLLLIFSAYAFAGEAVSMNIIGVQEDMPVLKAYINLYDEGNTKLEEIDKKCIAASLDGNAINITEIENLKDTEEGNAAIFLIDISKSLSTENFAELKSKMTQWVDEMGSQDAVSIITFGSEVNIICDFLSDKAALKEYISNLSLTDYETSFYEAVQTALTIASVENEDIPYTRQIVIITDGANVLKGSITKDEIIKNIEQKPYTIYGIGAFGGYLTGDKQAALDILGEFARTSKGKYFQKNLYEFDEMFRLIKADIDATQVVTFDCGEIKADGNNHNLYISYEKDSKKIDAEITARLVKNIPDTTVPALIDFKVISNNELEVYFSESVVYADNRKSYEIIDAIGQKLIPDEIVYTENEDEYKAILKFPVGFDGSYTVNISGIEDASGNILDETYEDFEVLVEKQPDFLDEYKVFILVGVGLLLMIAVIIFVLLTRRKKKEQERKSKYIYSGSEASQNKQENTVLKKSDNTTRNTSQKTNIIKSGPKKEVHLVIIDNKNQLKEMDKTFAGSMVIGRSSGCDINFPDGEMSRQHCKITFENNHMYIEDMKATNTTIVNGIPVAGRMRLNSGDSILVGQTEIKMTWKEE